MNQTQRNPITFEGEEAGAGYASPLLDLIASVFLIALSGVVIFASFSLPAPGGLLTAPGLLPFLTAVTLMLMAIMLAATALQRRAAGAVNVAQSAAQSTTQSTTQGTDEAGRDSSEDLRALSLALAVAVYIAALHFLAFQHNLMIGEIHYTLSAFEPVTIIALATIIQVSWRGPLWITCSVSIAWTLILSVVFQKVFLIPLPGGF